MKLAVAFTLAVLTAALGFAGGWLAFRSAPTTAVTPDTGEQTASPPAPKPDRLRTRSVKPPGDQEAARANPFEVSYVADAFDPPRRIVAPAPGKASAADPISAYESIYAANRESTPAAVEAVFAPAEREALRARFDDESMERNKSFFDSIAEEQLLEVVHYGEFRVLVLRSVMQDGQSVLRDMPLVQFEGQWWATNRLASDKSFMFMLEGIKEAYRE